MRLPNGSMLDYREIYKSPQPFCCFRFLLPFFFSELLLALLLFSLVSQFHAIVIIIGLN
jgi:hypothetical protein